MKKDEKQPKFGIGKEEFLQFLASASPEEVAKFIAEKGKPRKLIEPMIFFDNKQPNQNE